MQTLKVDLAERSYPIYIGNGLLEEPSLIRDHLRGRSVMLVSNETVAPIYLERLLKSLDGLRVETTILRDGEAFKTLDTLNEVLTRLLETRCDRKVTLIALGGGVIGDITGFAAAVYQRGVDFIQIPTTLLSQVDSSVGGKTGVNHALGKNMIGAFHQPNVVVIDTDTLDTLPDRELSAGLAEVIKYGLIEDAGFFNWLEDNIDKLRARNRESLVYAIHRACEIKAAIVAADERENGKRALLNLGHTFGHAIETAMGYGNWLHGEAVGTGMAMAAELSVLEGWMSEDELARTRALIEKAGLSVAPPKGMTPAQFMSLMQVDKKVMDGKMRLILLKGIGNAVITADFTPSLLKQVLDAG